MRSKIIIMMLFMLSFSIMHDTVFALIEKNHYPVLSSHTQTDNAAGVQDGHTIHSMFHFVGLTVVYQSPMLFNIKEETFFYPLLPYNQTYKDPSFRPPIV